MGSSQYLLWGQLATMPGTQSHDSESLELLGHAGLPINPTWYCVAVLLDESNLGSWYLKMLPTVAHASGNTQSSLPPT